MYADSKFSKSTIVHVLLGKLSKYLFPGILRRVCCQAAKRNINCSMVKISIYSPLVGMDL